MHNVEFVTGKLTFKSLPTWSVFHFITESDDDDSVTTSVLKVKVSDSAIMDYETFYKHCMNDSMHELLETISMIVKCSRDASPYHMTFVKFVNAIDFKIEQE